MNLSKLNMLRGQQRTSPPTPSGTSSTVGKIDEEDDEDVDTTDECDSKGNLDEVEVDEAEIARREEARKGKQRVKIETWERTLPGSGKLLFWWYILVSGTHFLYYPDNSRERKRLLLQKHLFGKVDV